jgi:glyceraldehyde 3-phosphate dehydrogenase
MDKIRVAINGFGRIGRAFFKQAWERSEIEIVAINDLGSPESLAYLLQYDSVYREQLFKVEVVEGENKLRVIPSDKYFSGEALNTKEIPVLAQKDPAELPWDDLNIDVVIESTGFFTEYEKAKAHIAAGAKRVVISAPGKSSGPAPEGEMVVLNANEDKFKNVIVTSNASCTTNAANPLIVILDEAIGIEKALLNTVHAYTASQALVDGPSRKDLRDGRGAAQNIVPSSTGAAKAVGTVYQKIQGKFDGISLRVPVPAGSIVDITFIASRDTSAEEVNEVLEKAAQEERWQGIFRATGEPLVSSDILGDTHASIADLGMTRVVGGNLVKVLGWYDNEWGYTHTLVEHVVRVGSIGK